MGIGPTEMLLILLVLVLLFGASRLPQLGRSVGEGIRNLKKGLSGDDAEDEAEGRERGERRGSKRRRVEPSDEKGARGHDTDEDEDVGGHHGRRERAS